MTLKYNFKKDKVCLSEFAITIHDRIAIVQIPDQFELGMLFLRCQEYYESPCKEFNNQPFVVLDFMNWYRKEMKSKSFTYPEDYIGYNIPLDSINP